MGGGELFPNIVGEPRGGRANEFDVESLSLPLRGVGNTVDNIVAKKLASTLDEGEKSLDDFAEHQHGLAKTVALLNEFDQSNLGPILEHADELHESGGMMKLDPHHGEAGRDFDKFTKEHLGPSVDTHTQASSSGFPAFTQHSSSAVSTSSTSSSATTLPQLPSTLAATIRQNVPAHSPYGGMRSKAMVSSHGGIYAWTPPYGLGDSPHCGTGNVAMENPHCEIGSAFTTLRAPIYSPQVPIHPPQAPTYSPQVPVYSPQMPIYSPQGPTYSPQAPVYSPQMPIYSPQGPTYSPQVLVCSPQAPTYSPQVPVYSPHTPIYSPQAPAYSPHCATEARDTGSPYCGTGLSLQTNQKDTTTFSM